MTTPKVPRTKWERRPTRAARVAPSSALPAIGLEAEFTTVVDGVPQTPEDVFGSPRNFIRGPLIHRTGRSYHLPTGGAIYFDTGVMEIATPMIEISRGCGARGTRALWESIAFLRGELDDWERRTGRTVTLSGFSAHYNVSFEVPQERGDRRGVRDLAYLLTHILAAPVMLLAANRKSTGVGVRPRGNRVEVTADFTPDAALMAATATLIVGVVRAVMRWPEYTLAELDRRGIPIVRGFVPIPHSSRKGWVAKHTCFPRNPFTADVNRTRWTTRTGDELTLREMAGRTTRLFWPRIRELADATSLELIAAVMRGRARSLLELDDRPRSYDDVGRLCKWNDLFPVAKLARSRYERVVFNAVRGGALRISGAWHRPIGMQGWTHVVFKREPDGARRVLAMDELLKHLGAWGRATNRRLVERRAMRAMQPLPERRLAQRRTPPSMPAAEQTEVDVTEVPPMRAEIADAPRRAPDDKEPSRAPTPPPAAP